MPVTNPETLRADAAAGRLQPVYLLVGDDDRLATALVNAVSDVLEQDLRAFNYERIYASDKGMTPAAVVEAARIAPMMSARRIVVVLRAEAWLKPKRAPLEAADDEVESEAAGGGSGDEKGGMAPVIEYLKAPIQTTSVVFVAADVNKGTAAVKAFYKSATVVECWGLADRDAPRGGDGLRQALAVVKGMAAAAGRQFEPAAAQLLAQRSGGDIARLRADIDHALLFAQGRRAITRADVEAVVSDRETVQDHWAMTNAMERGDVAVALRQLALLLEEGAAPVLVLGQLAWFARDKLPRIRPNQVSTAVQAVFRTDLDLKSSAGDARILLERLVLELCQAVRPHPQLVRRPGVRER